MTTQTVQYVSATVIACSCEPMSPVVMCVDPAKVAPHACLVSGVENTPYSFVEGALVSVTKSCSSYTYIFQYDDTQLNTGQLLTPEDITSVFCKGCFTDWVEQLVGNEISASIVDGQLVIVTQHGCQIPISLPGSCAADSDTIDMTVDEDGCITGDVIISPDSGNDLEARGNGLYTTNDIPEQVSVEDFNPVGNGVTDDTAAVQAALSSGAKNVFFPRTYAAGLLIVPPTVKKIFGNGGVNQVAPGPNVFSVTGHTDLEFNGITITGVAGAVSASDNNGIYVENSSRIKILNCKFTGLRYNAIYMLGVSDFLIQDSLCYAISDALCRLGGCHRGSIANNVIRDTQLGSAALTNAIVPDIGVFSHSYGLGSEISVIGNEISGYPAAQAIFGHAADKFTIVGNVINGSCFGISFLPYSGSGAGDVVKDLTISGNTIEGTLVNGAEPNGYGIIAGGSPLSQAFNISITGNTIRKANANAKVNGEGGIAFNYTTGIVVTGNSIHDSYENGITFLNPCVDVLVANNNINGVNKTTFSNAIYLTPSSVGTTGKICNNTIRDVEVGVRMGAVCLGLDIHDNDYFNLKVGGVQIDIRNRAICDKRSPYTAGDTTPSVPFMSRTMEITNAGATSITDFDDWTQGQLLTLYFNDANTTVVRSALIRLAGGVNFVSANRATLTLLSLGGTWTEVARATGA